MGGHQGSEPRDDTPSVENFNLLKKEKPEQDSLASYFANFGIPETPLLQTLLDDLASELRKYREYWKKRREQYKIYWRNVQEKCRMCLDFLKGGLYMSDNETHQQEPQEQQEFKKEAHTTAGGSAYSRKSSPKAVWGPADRPGAGFARQGQNAQ